MNSDIILAVETSCDDTSAAILHGERDLLGHVIAMQDLHEAHGGVVPEVASREQLRAIDHVVDEALTQAGLRLEAIGALAVTSGPGLIGSLLVGLNWVKTVAFALGRPFLGIHHMEAHVFAASLEHEDARPPMVATLVSGGHSMILFVEEWGRYRLLGATRDDAAGEAFDKTARTLGLGYPGGPVIEKLARDGDARRHDFSVPMLHSGQQPGDDDYYDMSFSGLKTAVLLRVRELEAEGRLEQEIPDLCASFQRAALEQVAEKTARAVREYGSERVVLGGGVARNAALAETIRQRLGSDVRLFVPEPRLASDNAAMVARAARFRLDRGERHGLDLNARADLPLPGLV